MCYRYALVWKMLNDVLLVAIVPTGTNLLTAARVVAAAAQLLLLYCKSTGNVTMDRIFRKYVQARAVRAALHARSKAPSPSALLPCL